MNNNQKYDEYYKIFKSDEDKFLKQFFPNGLPPTLYCLGRLDIVERTITGAHVSIKGVFQSGGIKIKNKDVEYIKQLASTGFVFESENVYIDFKYRMGDCGYSGAEQYSKILGNKNYSFNRSDLDDALSKNIEMYQIKDGDISCAYCGKAVQKSAAVKDYVIARQYPMGRKEFEYCSKACATYNQMAHEG